MNADHALEGREEEWAEPEWVLAHLQDPLVRIAECSSLPHLNEEGHLPRAVLLDLETDFVFGGEADEGDGLYFSYLCAQRGILPGTLCILYGDRALEALRIFQRFGHRQSKVLRGGREAWVRRGYPLSFKEENVRRARARVLSTAEIVSVRCYSHEW